MLRLRELFAGGAMFTVLCAGCATLEPTDTGAERLGLPAAPAGAPELVDPSSLIAVDVDPAFRTLEGAEAAAMIEADTAAAALDLDAAIASSSAGADASGVVGDVQWLYADGWQTFTLRAIGGNAEIWVANDMAYPAGDPRPEPVVTQAQCDYMLAQFNDNIYPEMVEHYGPTLDRDGQHGLFAGAGYDWYATDNPQRVMILVFNIVDESYFDPTYPFYTAGYFWATMNDAYADRNIIHIDSSDWANRVGPDAAIPHLYEQIFTHEYEHAIHYDHDAGEASWVDEGMADLAPYLVGYGHSAGHLAYYLVYHRTPLTVWGGGLESYGASYLFQLYLMENFGGPAFTRALVDEQANGIEGIENQLAAFGHSTSFDQVYRDWTVANYLDQPELAGISGAQLGYDALDIPSADTWDYSIQFSVEEYYGADTHGALPLPRYYPGGYTSGTVEYPIGELAPYAPLYRRAYGMEPRLQSRFRGAAAAGVSAHEGSYELWGSRGDLMFNTAELAAPVTLGADATLSFWTNYVIEEQWDFGFVQISVDGGEWVSLANDHTRADAVTDAHPDVLANLPGFTGSSGGWVEEVFDLSAYAGQPVRIRFLYVTDWSYTDPGMYVDEVVITDATGTVLSDGLEDGGALWTLDGFEHTTGLVENDWAITFINPVYRRESLDHLEISDGAPAVSGPYSYDNTILNTINLRDDAVTVIVSNRQPEAMSSPAAYRLLLDKLDRR